MSIGEWKKRLYLHIGTEKTGSTSIQVACAMNRERLRKAGFLYPRVPGERTHIRLTLYAIDDGRSADLRPRAGLGLDRDYERFKHEFQHSLLQEISQSSCGAVVLSNEHLSSRLHRVEEINRLAEIVREIADSIEIIAYLRPQHELVASSYSTSVKSGSTAELELPIDDENPYFNYELLLEPWASVFGEGNIRVRIYDRLEMPTGDVVKDFLSTIGFEIPADFEYPSDRNPALDEKTIQFLLRFNRHVPPSVDGRVNPDRGDIVAALESISRGHRISLPEGMARKVLGNFEASNANVARRYLGRSDGVLFTNLQFSKGEPDGLLTAEEAVAIAARLWRRNQRQLGKLRS